MSRAQRKLRVRNANDSALDSDTDSHGDSDSHSDSLSDFRFDSDYFRFSIGFRFLVRFRFRFELIDTWCEPCGTTRDPDVIVM